MVMVLCVSIVMVLCANGDGAVCQWCHCRVPPQDLDVTMDVRILNPDVNTSLQYRLLHGSGECVGGSCVGAPCECVGAPCECVGAPCECVGAPCECVGVPCECVGAPCECVGAPCECGCSL